MRSNYTCARSGPKHRPAAVDALFAGRDLPKSKAALNEVREYIRGLEGRGDSLHAEVARLQGIVDTIGACPELWCRKCGWTGMGSDALWTDGSYEYPNDRDPFCPVCGRDDFGFPASIVDEFDPVEFARACALVKEDPCKP